MFSPNDFSSVVIHFPYESSLVCFDCGEACYKGGVGGGGIDRGINTGALPCSIRYDETEALCGGVVVDIPNAERHRVESRRESWETIDELAAVVGAGSVSEMFVQTYGARKVVVECELDVVTDTGT